jgi:hypothetical protein
MSLSPPGRLGAAVGVLTGLYTPNKPEISIFGDFARLDGFLTPDNSGVL